MSTEFTYLGKKLNRQSESESILNALIRHGYDISNSCRMGACQCCKLKAKDPNQVSKWQNGLTPERKEQGYFLSCRAKPEDETIEIIPSE